jgi:putative molybdopterin biosynthesis protein
VAGNLDFVPLAIEHFDLLMRQRDAFRPRLQKLLRLLSTPIFASRAQELGGLDVSKSGTVRWAP